MSSSEPAAYDLGVNGREGRVFDSACEHGSPAQFPLDGVVRGFFAGRDEFAVIHPFWRSGTTIKKGSS